MSRRGTRFIYFLGFHTKPQPAACVYREDDVVRGEEGGGSQLKVGATLKVKPGRARESTSVRVLAIGAKGKLGQLKVGRVGQVYQSDDPIPHDDEIVGTPFQEKKKEIANSSSAQREQHLTEVADSVVNGVPAAEVPTKKVKVSRAPKRLQPPAVVELQEKVRNLSCWQKQPGDMALITGSPVYRNGATLNYIEGDLKGDPIKMFKKIVDLCLEDLVGDPGLCSTESGAKHRGKVAVPPAIPQGAYGYVTLSATQPVEFEPTYVLRTHLYKAQSRRKTQENQTTADKTREDSIQEDNPERVDMNSDSMEILPKDTEDHPINNEQEPENAKTANYWNSIAPSAVRVAVDSNGKSYFHL